jgi:hypothetical protein
MEFPITDLLSREQCTQWIVKHFYRNSFGCKHCGTEVGQSPIAKSPMRWLKKL